MSFSCSNVTGCKAKASCNWRCTTSITWNCHIHYEVNLVPNLYQALFVLSHNMDFCIWV
jgi:hypothetical protein